MKKFFKAMGWTILLLMLIFCSTLQNTQAASTEKGQPGTYLMTSSYKGHFQQGGVKGLLFIPKTVVNASSRPLVIFLHGVTDDPDTYKDISYLDELAAKYRFSLLSIQNCWALLTEDQSTVENTAVAIGDSSAAAAEFVTKLKKQKTFAQAGPVYVTGFSAGGFCALGTLLDRPDLYSGLGDFKGNFYADALHDLLSNKSSLQRRNAASFKKAIHKLKIYMAVGGKQDRPRIIEQMHQAKTYFEKSLKLKVNYKQYPSEGHWISDQNFLDFWKAMQ